MRLIDADALKERFDLRIDWLKRDVHDEYSMGLHHGAETDVELIDEMPTISPESLRPKGRWKFYHKQGIAVCTNCSFERDLKANFGRAIGCPNCGARMSEE